MVNNEKHILRYARQTCLPEIGRDGQEKLGKAKVLVVGVGGLGSPVALYLAAAGIGSIGIIDEDKIELHNLQRQIMFDTYYLTRPKVEIAAERLTDLNPEVKVEPYNFRLTADNISGIINNYDIVADCTDNFETRFLINDHCMEQGKILVSAAVSGFEGQLYTFKKGISSYRDIYDVPPEGLIPSCEMAGIMGSTCGIVGSMQANEVIKEVLGMESLAGHMLVWDGIKNDLKKIKL